MMLLSSVYNVKLLKIINFPIKKSIKSIQVKMKIKSITISFILILFTQYILSQSWSPIADMGDARYGAVSFTIGDKGYVGVGKTFNSTKKSVWEYNSQDDTWTQKADFAGGNRRVAFGFATGDKGYLGTGRDDNGANGNGNLNNDFWEYDPVSNSWTQKNNFGGGNRETAISFVIDGIGYAGLGLSGSRDYDFWKYDPSTDAWTQLQNIDVDFQLYNSSTFVLNGMAYFGLGSGFDRSTYRPYTSNEFFKYNPLDDSWTQLNNFGGLARRYATSFILNGKAYVGLGKSGVYLDDIWRYNEIDDSWQETNISGLTRAQVSSFVINNEVYVGNGVSTSQFHNDFYKLSETSLAVVDNYKNKELSIIATNNSIEILLTNNAFSNYNVSLYDISGKKIFAENRIPINGTIKISKNFQKGIFIIILKDLERGKRIFEKIVIR